MPSSLLQHAQKRCSSLAATPVNTPTTTRFLPGGDDVGYFGVGGVGGPDPGPPLQAEPPRAAKAGSGKLEFVRRLRRLELLLRLPHRKRHVSHGELIINY